MRSWVWLGLGLAALVSGCAGPIPTREIYFYRYKDINGGKPIQVDIIYPQTEAERNAIWQTTPEVWYASHELFDKVPKEEFDVRGCQGPGNDCYSIKRLEKKTKQQQWMIIIAELGKRPEGAAPAPGQKQLIYYEEKEKPHKREYIRIHQGYIERLDRRPRE